MNNKLLIRDYKKQDEEIVLNLLRLNTPAYFSPAEEKDLIYYLNNEIERYFVMELNNELIGCGGINFSEDKTLGKISWDILHPDHQGKGFGTLLLDHRITELNKIDSVKKITVRTSQLAYKFYKKSGFKLVETVKDYWANGFDLYLMEYSPTTD